MTLQDTNVLFAKLDEMGEETVRLRLAQGAFERRRKVPLVRYWLSKKRE